MYGFEWPTSYHTFLWILVRMVLAIRFTVTEKALVYACAVVTLKLMIAARYSVQFLVFIWWEQNEVNRQWLKLNRVQHYT